MKCPNCTFENPADAVICTKCGELLVTAGATHIIDHDDPDSAPKYGAIRFENSLTLAVVDGDAQFIFQKDDIDELIIGRADGGHDDRLTIDLSAQNAMEQGVSRHHAVIIQRDNALHIRDNESSNGTFLNGQKLMSNKFRVLRDGDDIQLGKILLRVTFN